MKICNVNTGKIIKRVLGLPLYSVYFLSWLFPRDKKIWVFGCNDGFVSNPKYLFLYTANKRDEIKTVWISKEEDVRRKLRKMGYNAQSRQSFKGIYYVLKAKYFFVNQNSHEISYWLSGGSKKIILWHGLPFKKISYDAKKGRFGYFSNLNLLLGDLREKILLLPLRLFFRK